MIRKLVYKSGVFVHNRSVFPAYRSLLESQHWSLDRLREHQLAKLKILVKHAYDSSPFYKARFTNAGITPNQIQSLDDLGKLPTVSKKELLDHNREIQVANFPGRHFMSETSGSTGQPLVFYRSQMWDAWHNASVWRGYHWHGVQPWERNGYLWGYNFSILKQLKTRLLDETQNRFRMFSYETSEIQAFVKSLRSATYLGGYSSMIYEVAKVINEDPSCPPLSNLKLVKGTSEKIFDAYQKEAVMAFGRRIISEYGAAETGIIAFECPAGKMHVNMETCIVETENEEVLVTNLVSDSFPVIRYRLGDSVRLDASSRCDCGREHEIIEEVTGRVGKPIFGHHRKYPSLTLYYVFKNLASDHGVILNYQAVQNEKGRLQLNLEGSLDEPQRLLLRREVDKYFSDDLDVTIAEQIDLRSPGRKKQDFVTTLA